MVSIEWRWYCLKHIQAQHVDAGWTTLDSVRTGSLKRAQRMHRFASLVPCMTTQPPRGEAPPICMCDDCRLGSFRLRRWSAVRRVAALQVRADWIPHSAGTTPYIVLIIFTKRGTFLIWPLRYTGIIHMASCLFWCALSSVSYTCLLWLV